MHGSYCRGAHRVIRVRQTRGHAWITHHPSQGHFEIKKTINLPVTTLGVLHKLLRSLTERKSIYIPCYSRPLFLHIGPIHTASRGGTGGLTFLHKACYQANRLLWWDFFKKLAGIAKPACTHVYQDGCRTTSEFDRVPTPDQLRVLDPHLEVFTLCQVRG